MNVILVAGGTVDSDQLRKVYASTDDAYVIGADRGALTLLKEGIPCDIAIGDFDSVSDDEKEMLTASEKTELLKPEKNDTDSEHAFMHALSMKPDSITLFGCTGSRLDHTLACINMLKKAFDSGIDARIVDIHNRIRVAAGEVMLSKADAFGKYVSVLPYGERIASLTEKGFKYEVEDFTLEKDISRGISNELSSEEGRISSGDYMIIMETID